MAGIHDTMFFNRDKETRERVDRILSTVYEALKERGYDPKSQMVGYLSPETLPTSPPTRMPAA